MEYEYLFLLLFLLPLVSANQTTCESIYYNIIQTNWNLNETEIENTYNINFTQFIETYPENCQIKYKLNQLPEKPNYQTLLINKTNQTTCSTELNAFFDVHIPTKEIYLGEISCSKTNIFKYIVTLNNSSSYSITGIKIWWIISIFLLIFVYQIKKSNS